MSFEDLEAGYRIEPRRMMNGSQDITQAIASGIFQFNTAVSRFQRLVKTLGTPNDTPEFRQKLNKTRLDISQLVSSTSDKLKQASETGHLDEVNASNKIRAAKLAKDFQAILKEYQKVQRFAAEKEIALTPVVQQVVLPSTYTDDDIQEKGNKDLELQALVMDSRRQVVLQLDNEIAFNEAVIEEREQGIQEIHQQIGEVHEIFKDLAVLVHEQGTMINSIQSNIEGSRASTTEAKTQLVKAAKSQKSNSSLTCLVIVMFGVILLILVVVLVS